MSRALDHDRSRSPPLTKHYLLPIPLRYVPSSLNAYRALVSHPCHPTGRPDLGYCHPASSLDHFKVRCQTTIQQDGSFTTLKPNSTTSSRIYTTPMILIFLIFL